MNKFSLICKACNTGYDLSSNGDQCARKITAAESGDVSSRCVSGEFPAVIQYGGVSMVFCG